MAKRTARPAARRPRRSTPRRRWRLIGALLKWGVVIGIWSGVLAGAVIAYYAYDLPDVDGLSASTRKPSVTLTDRRGTIFASYGEYHAGAVYVEQLPSELIEAVIATEDRRFYEHFGVDLIGIARALYANLKAGRVRQGGSTISQQLAKNLFLTPERTIERKVQEMLLALWLEHKFTKDQLLTIYLNRVYLGAGTYGVEAAARRYFGRSAREVTLYEAAMLAGLLKAPSRYNPSASPEAAARRTAQVLANMVAAGYLDAAEAEAAVRRGSPRLAQTAPRVGRHFADYVMDQVGGFVGALGRRDLTVRTTLDLGLQRDAERLLKARMAREGAANGASEAALVTLAPDGAVRAMVGGRSYARSQFNRAVQAQRQPGSAFKLFVYLPALESGLKPDTVLVDAPVDVDGWRPRNFDQRSFGEVTLREAVARSINTVAVRVAEQTGRDRIAAAAERLGVASPLTPHPSLSLGASEVNLLELTAAYAVLANGGYGLLPYAITEIRDRDGTTLYARDVGPRRRVVGARALAALHDVLRASIVWGTGKAANIERPAGGKTGTSQDFRDAWFVGFTADLTTGVWVGNDNGAPMAGVTGGGLPARIWKSLMAEAHADRPARALAVPSGEVPRAVARLEPGQTPEGVDAARTAAARDDGDAPQYGRPAFLERIRRAREEGR